MVRAVLNNRWNEIEKTQQQLRESIEESRQLAERSEELLNKHRREMENSGDREGS